ncbi:response regulator transcription factor [Azospirillum doebereinerae]|uniref:Response regulator transcription factor n=1 Tax=Azospirillum doebereinerae TaxID=92933 RepID=A0A3S0UZ04_9PROT|nr:response regulator transcription factor [Azospirillum doebereinerae]MCG5243474.1 response regulator transcription factor [Azospirillum doebereinerae]RUQ66212.1 response regulator transcription factor [Azospirillum doebereinerae]
MKRRDMILVVDDNPDTLGFLTEAIERADLTVLVAVDGESALELLGQITPDLILMDAVMPGLDGFETCRRLKQVPHLSHLPVVFMTGLSETEHVVRGLEAGGVDYVTKPIVVDELIARIRVHLNNARVSYAARAALDATGRFLLATDGEGRLLWCTPQAERLLTGLLPGADGRTPPLAATLAEGLTRLRQTPPVASAGVGEVFPLEIPDGDGVRRLDFSYLSPANPDEYLYRLSEPTAGRQEAILRDALGLTAREAEVLLWIANGKANRDIGEILGISPRTVNKHLEQVFAKLGVENRASAAALAIRALAARG